MATLLTWRAVWRCPISSGNVSVRAPVGSCFIDVSSGVRLATYTAYFEAVLIR